MQRFEAFTYSHNVIAGVLVSDAIIYPAFDPTKTPTPPKGTTYKAIWDTGATNSVITKQVVTDCKLKPTGVGQVRTAGGTISCNTYLVNIMLPNNVGYVAVAVTEAPLTGSENILIGMDIIATGDFSVTNVGNKTTFSFRHPSIQTIDYVSEANRLKQIKKGKIGRNEPCPCGSGKKYKRCHGI